MRVSTVHNQDKNNSSKSETNTEWSKSRCDILCYIMFRSGKNGKSATGCNQAIMLVTDGVPYPYDELFRVRLSIPLLSGHIICQIHLKNCNSLTTSPPPKKIQSLKNQDWDLIDHDNQTFGSQQSILPPNRWLSYKGIGKGYCKMVELSRKSGRGGGWLKKLEGLAWGGVWERSWGKSREEEGGGGGEKREIV